MAKQDEPRELKSLFTRIKDAVLIELRRNSDLPKRASCPSRNTWPWQSQKNGNKEVPLPATPGDDSLSKGDESGEKATSNTTHKDVTDAKKSRERAGGDDASREARQSAERSESDKEAKIKKRSTSVNENEKHRGDRTRRRGETHVNEDPSESSDGEREMSDRGRHERSSESRGSAGTSDRSGDDGDRERSGGSRRGRQADGGERSATETEKKAEEHSCGSDKFKPVRYYIKMQNPEAPVCCASVKPRKICPPKVRRTQRQCRDSFEWRPNTCRCSGCSSAIGGKP